MMKKTHINITYIKSYLLTLIALAASTAILAQQDTIRYDVSDTLAPALSIIGSYHQGKVHLRWAPNTSDLWYATSAKGYKVLKYEIKDDLYPDTATKREIVVKPWPMNDFKPYLDVEKSLVLAAGQCLYGEWETSARSNQDLFSKADEAKNRYSIAMLVSDMDSVAARSLGLSLVDQDVVMGKTYFYLLRPNNDSLAALYSIGVSISINNKTLPQLKIDTLTENEKSITLYWEKFDNSEFYTGYWVERRQSASQPFVRITEEPIVPSSSVQFQSQVVSYKDSVVNYIPYEYRIVGITPFGYLSEPSESLRGMGRDRTPPGEVTNFVFREENESIVLTWTPPKDKDLDHFEILRSLTFGGPYERINTSNIPKTQYSFTDTSMLKYRSPYYVVNAIDTAGNGNGSQRLRGNIRDTIAPSPPTNLRGIIDSTGVVTLLWNANPERDIDGYYVYFANKENHQFTNLTGYPIRRTTFSDTITLKTLTEKIFYRVAAADYHNHISDFSEMIELKRPDTIPPFPAQIVGYLINEDHIQLAIQPSLSEDVFSQKLYKKASGENEWSDMGEVRQKLYDDRAVMPGITYTYKLETIDDDGNFALRKEPISITMIDKSLILAPDITSIVFDTTAKGLIITWKTTEVALQSILYRSVNNGPFVTLGKSVNCEYIDKDGLRNGSTYAYKIKQIVTDGRQSPLSKPTSVNLKLK